MSYEVLARKWRPRRFQDIVGQELTLRILTNALQQKRIHHAYLFTGTRGVGKTTLARLLAKCLNCESDITSTPCESCYACKAIQAGQFVDLYEVDAASRTKVEDTRELLENVLYPPTVGRYKIYLIDEVHMLSNHSFNALLKTLEEPPDHVKFLLATTDPKRLPITILSRCLQFHLKRISMQSMTEYLQQICQAENIHYELPALTQLAKAADGSLRDALSLLDQAIAFGEGRVLAQEISALLSTVTQEAVLTLMEALNKQNGEQLFKEFRKLTNSACDCQQLLEELINKFHELALLQIAPKVMETDANEIMKSLAKAFSPEEVQLYYQIALLGKRDLAYAASPEQGVEMTLLRMLAFKPISAGKDELPSETDLPQLSSLNANKEVSSFTKEISHPQAKTTAEPNKLNDATALNNSDSLLNREWRELLPKLQLSGMAQALAANCTLTLHHENKIQLALSTHHEAMLNPKLKERIAEKLSQHFNKPINLTICLTTTEMITPQSQDKEEQATRLLQAKNDILENKMVKQLIEMYDANVEISLLI